MMAREGLADVQPENADGGDDADPDALRDRTHPDEGRVTAAQRETLACPGRFVADGGHRSSVQTDPDDQMTPSRLELRSS